MVDSLWFQVRFVDTFAHHFPVPVHDTGQCGHHQGRQRCCQPWGGVGKLLFGPGQFVTLFSDVDILKLWSPLGHILKPSITEANGYLSYLIVVLFERRSAKFGQDLQRDYLSCIQEVCVDFHSVPVLRGHYCYIPKTQMVKGLLSRDHQLPVVISHHFSQAKVWTLEITWGKACEVLFGFRKSNACNTA